VFVPENDRATNWLKAGNTVEYTGSNTPAGAPKIDMLSPEETDEIKSIRKLLREHLPFRLESDILCKIGC